MYYLIYGFLYLLSLLPFRVLYFISDGVYLLIYYVIGYRRDVVMNNIGIAFPEKTKEECTVIAKQFYHNFIDSFIENIKMFSISEKAFDKRCTGNFDLINKIAEKGGKIQLHAGHQFNWEYANWFYAKNLSLPFVVVYMPISNNAINKIYLKLRTRFKTVLVNARTYGRSMHNIYKNPYILNLVADQNPGYPQGASWLQFFSKAAPFLGGPEKGARKNNTAVIFVRFVKLKRGYYYFENHLVTENAAETEVGEITSKYRDFVEESIRRQPSNYLWSHRRWKFDYQPEYKHLWIE